MDIPVMPVRTVADNTVTSHILFSGTDVRMDDNSVSFMDLVRSLSEVCDKGTPMIVADVDGLQKRDIEPNVIRKLRSKREMWLMTGIRNDGDVMDAFHGDISKIIVPYHLTSDRLLREMNELSDCCIPALFVDDKGVHMNGPRKELRTVVRIIENIGLRKMLVFDVSDDSADRVWSPLADLAGTVIPYAPSKEDADIIHDMGFNDVMVSGIKLLRSERQRSEIRSCMLP
ncbi:MAG: hypothetical protein LBE47_03210 [Methanomassiliicoccaceae archaeon]|jgi:hypothetical protein|nr:hypothetical protein [Methanomassiliicoccaceae archaeon]